MLAKFWRPCSSARGLIVHVMQGRATRNNYSHRFMQGGVDLAARRLDARHQVLVDLHPAGALLTRRLQLLSRFLQLNNNSWH